MQQAEPNKTSLQQWNRQHWRRVLDMLRNPGHEWEAIAEESASVMELMSAYVIPFSVLNALVIFVGMTYFNSDWDVDFGYRVGEENILAATLTTFLLSLTSVLLLAGVFRWVAPMYERRCSYADAMKVAVYGAVPVWLGGMLLLIPLMVMAAMLMLLISFYYFDLGARKVLHIRSSDSSAFIAISLLLHTFLSMIVGGVLSALGLM